MKPREPLMDIGTWTYRGITAYPAPANSAGIRWHARPGGGITLKADTKARMRQLISESADKGSTTR